MQYHSKMSSLKLRDDIERVLQQPEAIARCDADAVASATGVTTTPSCLDQFTAHVHSKEAAHRVMAGHGLLDLRSRLKTPSTQVQPTMENTGVPQVLPREEAVAGPMPLPISTSQLSNHVGQIAADLPPQVAQDREGGDAFV